MKGEDDERPKKFPRYKLKYLANSCTNKIPFGSEKTAEKARQHLLKKSRGDTRIYKCGSHYHLTSSLTIPTL